MIVFFVKIRYFEVFILERKIVYLMSLELFDFLVVLKVLFLWFFKVLMFLGSKKI